MTLSTIRGLLEARFYTTWATATPIAWQNVDYTPVSGTSFVTFRILPNAGDYASLGKHPLIRTLGLIEINIMTPVSGGTQTGNTHTDSAMAVFRDSDGRGWQSGKLTCRAGYVMDVVKESEWFRHIVIVPFEYDESF